ncbi:tubulin-specific chaperone D-like isoform X2 [Mya arenaria]|uniref:tubulin-specific chaperone D-like isoform X2 n=1 Tax=Mya arenaria TaxID=6604 RepID=UPI0022DF6A10|nr:tubulin-specific chaperone D-like isoform X2 [Mya arenaria]
MAADESNQEDDGMVPIGLGCANEEFKEVLEVKELLDSLPNVYNDQIAMETVLERFTFIIDQYQEQPHLIDPHLEMLMNKLLTIGRNMNSPPALQNLAFKCLYLITKMRGSKVVVRLFPHEVVDVEPVLALLYKQDPKDFEAAETRYILLLWLSMACMIPFDLVRLDSNVVQESGDMRLPVMDRIYNIAMEYLTVVDKSRNAAAYLMSRFMTRPDVKKRKLTEFMDWALKFIENAEYITMTGADSLTGVLTTIGLMFKHGKREDLLQYAPTVLEKVVRQNLYECNNNRLRKYGVKVVQRLGTTFLPSRVAKWRYQRGCRSIADNLQLSKEAVKERIAMETTNGNEEDDDEDYDIPEEMEEVIEMLLTSLKDKDTIVRWSAAKGIGRITGRLPKELADEVVGSLLELFNLQESDGAWHGGCLALAELGRRGLLLPVRLPDVVPIVLKALAYDERRGTYSVGAHVRDAACYVCWAFARAYEPKEIAKYVNQIACSLLIASIFDREVNVRRAASAAFQENVGRQGTFPHGIDILTKADYYAVGNRTHCYLDVSVYIAEFSEYTEALINHLADVKVHHWDSIIRELTAKALHNLTEKLPEHMAKTVLPQLLTHTTGLDLHSRHGTILAVAEITHALSSVAEQKNKTIVDMIDKGIIEDIKGIAAKLQDAKLFRGLGGELMRKAVACLVEKCSLAKMPYHKGPVIDTWQEILDDCWNHVEPDIHMAALSAIQPLCNEYYQISPGAADHRIQEMMIEKYLRQLRASQEITRQGHSLALGALPEFMLRGKLRPVLAGLIQATQITDKDQKWAEGRRDALKAITSVCKTVGVVRDGDQTQVICSGNVGQVYEALLVAMKDYTLDSRGDVGAWVREASMTGLQELTSLAVNSSPDIIKPGVCEHVMCSLVQQCCEKIDRTRAHAGNVFSALLYHEPSIPHIPNREELQAIFTKDVCKSLNWAAPCDTFPLFTQLIKYPTYTYSVILGLAVSVGGITGFLVKHSSAALHSYLRNVAKDIPEMTRITSTITKVFKDYQKVDRVSLPMLKMLDQLLSKGCFDSLIQEESHPFPLEMFKLVRTELMRCGDPQKLLASADVYCDLLQFPGEVRRMCLSNLCIFLCHRFPRIRKTTANKLYEVLVTYDDIAPEENVEELMTVLSETLCY